MKRGRERGGAVRGLGAAVPLAAGLLAASLLGTLSGAPAGPAAPTLLVLGAAQYSGRPSPAFAARLATAARLYRAGGVSRVVVSGGVGRGDALAEGEVGRRYLLALGLPPGRVRAETRSRSTLENLAYSRPLLGQEPVGLVTDRLHATRALALARALGLPAAAAPSPLVGPNPWHYAVREAVLSAGYAVTGAHPASGWAEEGIEVPGRLVGKLDELAARGEATHEPHLALP